jgi:hypothetical protein
MTEKEKLIPVTKIAVAMTINSIVKLDPIFCMAFKDIAMWANKIGRENYELLDLNIQEALSKNPESFHTITTTTKFKSNWMSIEEKIPPLDVPLLIINKGNELLLIKLVSLYKGSDILYWMRIPDLIKNG